MRGIRSGRGLSAVASLLGLPLLAACGSGKTVEYFDVQDGDSVAMSADLRAIIVARNVEVFGLQPTSVGFNNDGDVTAGNFDGVVTRRTVVCAEPQPDALRSVATDVNQMLQAALSKGNDTSLGVANSVAVRSGEAMASLSMRTPTVQLMRDSLYRACEGVINGVIDGMYTKLVVKQLDNLMIGLHAIDGLTGMRPAPAVTINAGFSSPGTGAGGNEDAQGGANNAAAGGPSTPASANASIPPATFNSNILIDKPVDTAPQAKATEHVADVVFQVVGCVLDEKNCSGGGTAKVAAARSIVPLGSMPSGAGDIRR